MKNTWNKALYALLSSSLLLASCDKEDTGELEGAVPESSFTTTSKAAGLATEVTFTATNNDAVHYQWVFDDGTVGSGQTITHAYKKSGLVRPQLIAAYRGGTSVSAVQEIMLPQNTAFVKQLLTGSGSKTWMLDNSVEAPIVVGTEGKPDEYYQGAKAGELPACQADDEYTFSSANVYTYNAQAETYVAAKAATTAPPAPAVPAACSASRSGTSEFTFGPATGEGYAMLELKNAGAFIGVTDAPDLTYRIIDITATTMVIRAGKPSGTVFQMKLKAKP